jgi:hypothetical protein
MDICSTYDGLVSTILSRYATAHRDFFCLIVLIYSCGQIGFVYSLFILKFVAHFTNFSTSFVFCALKKI